MSETPAVITALFPRLEAISRQRATDTLEAGDVMNSMVLALLEKAAADPNFLEPKPGFTEKQRDNYLVRWAVWNGTGTRKKNVVNAEFIYRKHVVSLEEQAGDPDEGIDWEDTFCDATAVTPEEAMIQHQKITKIMNAVKELDEENIAVISATFEGYSNIEIAAHLGVSPARVSQRRREIREFFKYYRQAF